MTEGQDIAQAVREGDRALYLSHLFAPETVRPELFALAAYQIELKRIVERAREPLAAEVRLQWWRDALRNEGFGAGGGVDLVEALRAAITRFGWPVDALASMSEGRIHDLYADPFADLDAFDGYAGETRAVPLQLAAIAMSVAAGEGADLARQAATAAGYGGVALAAADAAIGAPAALSRQRTLLPLNLWPSAEALREAVEGGTMTPAAVEAVRALAQHGLTADDRMRALIAEVPESARAALLPAFLARAPLEAAVRQPQNVASPGPIRTQWTLWRAAQRLAR
ncbi:MAG: squalene/phytoene synthase family protein [Pseudomonadota bacterium]